MTKRKTHTYRDISFVVPPCYISFEPSLKQLKLMIDMAAAIQNSPPPRFDMDNYCNFNDTTDILESGIKIGQFDIPSPSKLKKIGDLGGTVAHSCGTAACAIGTAAYHGVGRMTQVMNWYEYSETNFGLVTHTDMWEYVFGSRWASVDNSPHSAVARILQLVVSGAQVIRDKLEEATGINNSADDYYSAGDLVQELYNVKGLSAVTTIYQDFKNIKIGAI